MRTKDILRFLLNINSWHTKKKYVAIASDDWGGIRNSSEKTRQNLIKLGINMDSNRFDKYDTLESNKDMEELFNVLMRYKDSKGNHPVITAVTNVANPNFEKIKQSNYSKYYYETFDHTLTNKYGCGQVLEHYRKGIDLKIFCPELHGREHLQVNWWMQDIQNKNSLIFKAFENEYWYLSQQYIEDQKRRWYGASFDIANAEDLILQEHIVSDSIDIFKTIFGYSPIYFTPPSGIYNDKIEKKLYACGVRLVDVPIKQKMPLGNDKYQTKIHYTGQKSRVGFNFLIRNALFEPNLVDSKEAVDVCLSGMDNNFKLNLPIIISSHRASFVGGIDSKNREIGLKSLDLLLSKMLAKWPDIEFVSIPNLYHKFVN